MLVTGGSNALETMGESDRSGCHNRNARAAHMRVEITHPRGVGQGAEARDSFGYTLWKLHRLQGPAFSESLRSSTF